MHKDILLDCLEEAGNVKGIVSKLVVGVFMTALATSDNRMGCAYTYREPTVPHKCKLIKHVGNFQGMELSDVANLLKSDAFLERSIGQSALTATINSFKSELANRFQKGNILEYLKTKFAGKQIGMVGRFPFDTYVADFAGEFKVVELNPALADISGRQAEEYLESCDLVIITGVTLLNKTFSGIIKHCKKPTVMMLGPTVPLSQTLIDAGVDILVSLIATDIDKAFRFVQEGAIVPIYEGFETAILANEKLDIPEGDFRETVRKTLNI